MSGRVPNRQLEGLVRDGTLDARNVEQTRGLTDWEPRERPTLARSLSDVLQELRGEEDR